jgi:hypothetical protein
MDGVGRKTRRRSDGRSSKEFNEDGGWWPCGGAPQFADDRIVTLRRVAGHSLQPAMGGKLAGNS